MLQTIFFSNHEKIVIASSGRAGSTMLTDAVAEGYVSSKFNFLPKFISKIILRSSKGFIFRLENILKSKAPILKTHDIWNPNFSKKAKFIFVFGDPLESAKSCHLMQIKYGENWLKNHIVHLNGKGEPKDLFRKDILNYEKQLDSWSKSKEVLIIHYEKLWEYQHLISSFLNFPVSLPKKIQRSNKDLKVSIDKTLFQKLKDKEERLKKKFNNMN